MNTNVASLLRLPKKKRMEVAERLWLSVADESRMPIPLEHKKIIDSRLANYRKGITKPVVHADMMERLRSK